LALAELLPGIESFAAFTVAVSVTLLPALPEFNFTVIETVAVAPAARLAMLQFNVPAEPTEGGVQLQPPPGETNDTKVVLVGVGLAYVTDVAATEPWFLMTCV